MPQLIALTATLVAVVVCILIHYQAFVTLTGVMARHRVRRRGLILVMLGLLASHGAQIGVFAGLYGLLQQFDGFGGITSHLTTAGDLTFLEYYYFSSVVYTTLGFGDLVPNGLLRIVAGIEALAGFALITWSASFTFLEMQQFWSEGR